LPVAAVPAPNFNPVAPVYDSLARLVFGRRLLRAQHATLAAGLPAGAPRVLFIGGGTGQVLPELLRLRPMAQVLFLDASEQMLQRAQALVRAQLPGSVHRIAFRHGDETSLRANEQFDAVVAFFLFDLFTDAELQGLVDRLHRHTYQHTRWLVSDFAPPRRWWQRVLHGLMYWFFRLTSGITGRRLPDIPGALARAGVQPQWQQRWSGGLLETSVYER
jgi:ubiquinone/menaquinone biosynthesis C-methylase UbiE